MREPTPLLAVPIRVAVLGENRLFCEGLRRICAADDGISVVGDASLAGIRDVVRATSPDILIADAVAQGSLDICRELRRDGRRPWVLLVAVEADDEWAIGALKAGARGVFLKTSPAEALIKAIRVVHEGEIWVGKQAIARIVDELVLRSGLIETTIVALDQRLTFRKREIVRLTASGLSNKEIAERLAISEATVKAHLTQIFLRLGVRDRNQLTARYHQALRAGEALADPDPAGRSAAAPVDPGGTNQPPALASAGRVGQSRPTTADRGMPQRT